METILTKLLHPIRMTARMLVFEYGGREFFASRRVANEILSKNVEEVFVVESVFFSNRGERTKKTVHMLATPSCW